jgi:type II secretory pathway pseudopilin PulG
LTLIELMVAMSILIILTLAVSQIVAQAQRVVTVGHATMRGNGKIAALKSIVRDDFRRATPAGFLYLDSHDQQGFLAFTTTGFSDTVTPDKSDDATAAVAIYGLQRYYDKKQAVDGGSSDVTSDERILSRVSLLLNKFYGSGLDNASDGSPYDLADFQTNRYPVAANPNNSTTVDGVADELRDAFEFLPTAADPMNLLQRHLELGDITDHSWKVMTPHVTDLEFFWTDGSTSTAYVTGTSGPTYEAVNWFGGKAGKRKYPHTDTTIEIGGEYGGTDTGAYKARWTNNADPNDWPRAIRIVVTLNDESMKNARQYEIICPVGP